MNPIKKIKDFFSEEPDQYAQQNQTKTGITCENCQREILNKPKFFKMNGRRIVICKSCYKEARRGMGA